MLGYDTDQSVIALVTFNLYQLGIAQPASALPSWRTVSRQDEGLSMWFRCFYSSMSQLLTQMLASTSNECFIGRDLLFEQ